MTLKLKGRRPEVLPAGEPFDTPGLMSAKELLEAYNNVMAELVPFTPQQRYKIWEEVSTRLHRLEMLESRRRVITKDFDPTRSS